MKLSDLYMMTKMKVINIPTHDLHPLHTRFEALISGRRHREPLGNVNVFQKSICILNSELQNLLYSILFYNF